MTRRFTTASLGTRTAVASVWIVLLAIVCRAVALGARVHVDEAFSWYVSSAPDASAFLHRLAATENTPPLFYAVLSAMPGDSPAWLRIPAALPGVLVCVVVWRMTHPRLGNPAALLATLGVAVAPFLITYSDLARGFMLSDLALLAAVWSLLALADRQSTGRWLAFVFAGAVAVWTEYDAAIVLAALVVCAVMLGMVPWRRLAPALTLQIVAIAPWAGQIARAQDQLGVTKLEPMNAGLSAGALRDLVTSLAFGENGGTSNPTARWLLAIVILAVIGAGGTLLWRRRPAPTAARLCLLTGVLAVAGYAVAALAGVHVFSQRYMTVLVPLIAVGLAGALAALERPRLLIAAAALLCVLGIVDVAHRSGGEYEPDFSPVRAAVLADRPATVLTDTPTVLYYLQGHHARMDRSYNLGPGDGAACRPVCVAVDDSRVPGGTPRPPLGPVTAIGPFVISVRR